MSTFTIILLLVAVGWFWLDSSRSREIALGICQQASQQYGVQLLDESVELKKLSIRWPQQGLRIWRQYHFYFSKDGVERLQGSLALTGIDLDYLDFDFSVIDVNTDRNKISSGTVIPIKRHNSDD